MADFHNMCVFLRSERAQIAIVDPPTLMILVILLIIFITGAAHAYDSFNERREMMDKAESGLNFLDTLKNNILADTSGGRGVVKSGLIYINITDPKASINVNTSKTFETRFNDSNKLLYIYTANDPFKLGDTTKSIQYYWNRMYLYEVIIKDETDADKTYIFHAGWATKFSSQFTNGGETYNSIFDNLMNQRLNVVTIDLPVAIRYGNDFPEDSLKNQVRAGKIEVLIW